MYNTYNTQFHYDVFIRVQLITFTHYPICPLPSVTFT